MAHEKAAAKDKGRGIVWAQGLACGACVAIAPAGRRSDRNEDGIGAINGEREIG